MAESLTLDKLTVDDDVSVAVEGAAEEGTGGDSAVAAKNAGSLPRSQQAMQMQPDASTWCSSSIALEHQMHIAQSA